MYSTRMPKYLTPGVLCMYGPKSIKGVSTSTAGFLGATERGPVSPRLVTSFANYRRVYGTFYENSYLAYAVDGFFRNGGQRCFVARIATEADKDKVASNDISIGSNGKTLRIMALGPGKWGTRTYFKIENASSGD